MTIVVYVNVNLFVNKTVYTESAQLYTPTNQKKT